MAALRDRRHEKVAQLLAVMTPYEQASREAGYKDGSSFRDNARKRAQRPDIKARVAELQAKEADLISINAEWIRRNAAQVAGVEVAVKDIRASDKIAALHLLAKMTPGAIVPTKVEASGADGDAIEVNMDARSLARTILGIIREASADAPPEAGTDTETEPQE
jgi:hypothetical protein